MQLGVKQEGLQPEKVVNMNPHEREQPKTVKTRQRGSDVDEDNPTWEVLGSIRSSPRMMRMVQFVHGVEVSIRALECIFLQWR